MYKNFKEAREYARELELKTGEEWKRHCKSGKKPDYIPTYPESTYRNEWKGIDDWLGTGKISPKNKSYLPFEQARKFVHSRNIENVDEWINFCNSGEKPRNIPTYPYSVYSKEWTNWFDWLGKEGIRWDSKKIKELLSEMIKSGVLYNWDEAVLYSFFLRKGILNLSEGNKHKIFLKNIIQSRDTEDGKRAIENYVNSDNDVPPILEPSNFAIEDE